MTKLFLRAGLAVIFALFLGVNARSQQTLNNIPAELVAYPEPDHPQRQDRLDG